MPVRPLLEIGALVGLLAPGHRTPASWSGEHDPSPADEPAIDPDSLAPIADEHGRYLMNLSAVEVTVVLAAREVRKVAGAALRRVRRR